MAKMMRARPARPPTTPPAIAPAGGPGVGVSVGRGVVVVVVLGVGVRVTLDGVGVAVVVGQVASQALGVAESVWMPLMMLFPQMKMVRRLLEEPMVALETAVTQNGCEISLQHRLFAPIRDWDAHTE